MADEEALLVVIGIDEPAGDAVGAVAPHFTGVGVEDVHALDPYPDVIAAVLQDVDIGLAEDDEEVALAGVLEIAGHVKVGVHARLEHRDATELLELRGVGVVAEGAGNQHVEPGVGRLTCGGNQIRARDGAELRPDEDASAARGTRFAAAFHIAPLGADVMARPSRERREGDTILLVRLLHARGLQVLQNHVGEVRRFAIAELLVGKPGEELVVLVHRQDPMRRQALDRKGPGDADAVPVFIRLVVEILVVRLGGDGGVDLLLPRDARLPPLGVQG